jgi:hypothetical protein
MKNEQSELLQFAASLAEAAIKEADQRHRRKISERTSFALRKLQAGGKRVSHLPPFGWKVDPNDSARIVPDDNEQSALLRAKQFRDNGLSWQKVADQLFAEGFEPRPIQKEFKGKTVEVKGKWHRASLHRVLSKQNKQ